MEIVDGDAVERSKVAVKVLLVSKAKLLHIASARYESQCIRTVLSLFEATLK
jgi:hypothetical protein